MIEDVAYRSGSDALVRLCERLRYICMSHHESQPNKKLFSEPFFFIAGKVTLMVEFVTVKPRKEAPLCAIHSLAGVYVYP